MGLQVGRGGPAHLFQVADAAVHAFQVIGQTETGLGAVGQRAGLDRVPMAVQVAVEIQCLLHHVGVHLAGHRLAAHDELVKAEPVFRIHAQRLRPAADAALPGKPRQGKLGAQPVAAIAGMAKVNLEEEAPLAVSRRKTRLLPPPGHGMQHELPAQSGTVQQRFQGGPGFVGNHGAPLRRGGCFIGQDALQLRPRGDALPAGIVGVGLVRIEKKAADRRPGSQARPGGPGGRR